LEEEEEDYGPGKVTTAVVIIIALILALSVGAVLAFNLTPPYCTANCGGTTQIQGLTVKLPSGVGIQTNNLNFEPATITVVIGVNNTVSWVDQDSIPHTVTSLAGAPSSFDSGPLRQGSIFTQTFTVPGIYSYDCTFHPTFMKGTIIVKAAAA
jgi:plastocyanin